MSMSIYYINSSTDIYFSVIRVALKLVFSTRNHYQYLEIGGLMVEAQKDYE
jgi:hypothetical protein